MFDRARLVNTPGDDARSRGEVGRGGTQGKRTKRQGKRRKGGGRERERERIEHEDHPNFVVVDG